MFPNPPTQAHKPEGTYCVATVLAAAEPLGAVVAVPPELLPLWHVRLRGALGHLVLDQGPGAMAEEQRGGRLQGLTVAMCVWNE